MDNIHETESSERRDGLASFHNFKDAMFHADLATLHGGSTCLTPL